MYSYSSFKELLDISRDCGICEAVIQEYCQSECQARDAAFDKMRENLSVMKKSVETGLDPDMRSVSGNVGGQAAMYLKAVSAGLTQGGKTFGRVGAYALAAAENNACMGRIVAAPTAGACGVLPAALLGAQEAKGYTDNELVNALFVSAGIGKVIAQRASISGAEGGCQAECGTAAAMAASALTYLGGGSSEAIIDAACFSIINMLGLVCDPLNGLVEIPCVYRNVAGAAIAMSSSDIALSGIKLILNPDEVVDSMRKVGRQLPPELRETGQGGCASCGLK